jgi:hypothetical protein
MESSSMTVTGSVTSSISQGFHHSLISHTTEEFKKNRASPKKKPKPGLSARL